MALYGDVAGWNSIPNPAKRVVEFRARPYYCLSDEALLRLCPAVVPRRGRDRERRQIHALSHVVANRRDGSHTVKEALEKLIDTWTAGCDLCNVVRFFHVATTQNPDLKSQRSTRKS